MGLEGAVGVLGLWPPPGDWAALCSYGIWGRGDLSGAGLCDAVGGARGRDRLRGWGFHCQACRDASAPPRRAFQKPRGRAAGARVLSALPAEPLLLLGQSRRFPGHFSRDPSSARRLFAPRRLAGGVAMVHFLHASQSPRVIIPPDAQKDARGRVVVQVSPGRAGSRGDDARAVRRRRHPPGLRPRKRWRVAPEQPSGAGLGTPSPAPS